ncbi:MAG: SIMPL domain-containing protein [Clostridiales bacterium]|nr:SIMPL domain-containing protein [Clostridiales bacterium]
MAKKRTIRVTGKGELSMKPDTTRLTITLEGMNKDYGVSLQQSAMDTESLKDLMMAFGFERTDLKTLNFNVNTEYESYKYKGEYKQRFAGYKYYHVMKLEFPSDNERLGKIVYALAHSDLHPEFRLSYTVKDPDDLKNTALGLAVIDATKKAQVLAAAARVTLGELQTIDYSWGEMNLEVRPMERMLMNDNICMAKGMDAYEIDIEPDDINVSDTVTVVWEIT